MFEIIKDWLAARKLRAMSKLIAYGAYGSYYKLIGSSMGMKILFHNRDGWKYESHELKILAMRELNRLKQLNNKFPDLFPKPGRLIDVPTFGVGYTMEHIPEPYAPLYEMRTLPMDLNILLQQIQDDLWENGICHGDLHSSNVLYNPKTGDFKLIDPDPRAITDRQGECDGRC